MLTGLDSDTPNRIIFKLVMKKHPDSKPKSRVSPAPAIETGATEGAETVDCPQCDPHDPLPVTVRSELVAKIASQPVVSMVEYVAKRVEWLSVQLEEVERTTSVFMNQLIHERDHTIARRLQREIGQLDAQHSHLSDLMRIEKKRRQRYA